MSSTWNTGTACAVGTCSQKPSGASALVKPSEASDTVIARQLLVGSGANATGVRPTLLTVPCTWTGWPPAAPPLIQNVSPV